MDEIKAVRIAALTRNADLAERLERTSRHWADAVCVLTVRVGGDAPADILLWDADTSPPPDNAPAALIVVSDDESKAIAAYQRHPAALLPSRFRAPDFRSAMERCFPAWRGGLRWLDLSGCREPSKLPLGGIQYVEASGRESAVRCDNAALTVPAPMGKLAQQLPAPPFFRCQRSFIVNLSAVRSVSDDAVITVKDGSAIPISRKRVDAFREALARWNALEKQ